METLRIGHSPDADDAFMFYAFAAGEVSIDGFQVEQVLEDIESLNKRAFQGELEVTAISAASYPLVADQYRIMVCGSSIGRNYGPILLGKGAGGPQSVADLEGKRIGIPGPYTTAYLLLRIYLERPFEPVFLNFDAVGDAVKSGEVDAGLIIHEGQITWQSQGFANLMDLGVEWGKDTGLPIPLGIDVVHRRLGEDASLRVTEGFAASIKYALDHEDDAVDYSLPFGRGIDRETCRRFVKMYVNEDTLNMGQEGVQALQTMYSKAQERGIIPEVPTMDILGAIA